MPNADIKFYITASVHTRAIRRQLQQPEEKLEDVEKEIEQRDFEDVNRTIDPLKKADDAILIENDKMTLEETVEFMLNYINKA